MPNTCSTCLHYIAAAAGQNGTCAFYPSWVSVSYDHFCGHHHHRNALIAENGTERKFEDDELIKRIRENYGVLITWGDGLQLIADDFNVSKKTIEDHCRRLDRLQILEIRRGPHGRRESVGVHPAVDDWDWWVEHCKKTGESPKLKWKELVDAGNIPWPGKGTIVRKERPSVAKWTFAEHLLPALVASCPDEAQACRYSTIAGLVESSHKIPRSAFDRLLRQAVEDGKAVKTDGGLYYLKNT